MYVHGNYLYIYNVVSRYLNFVGSEAISSNSITLKVHFLHTYLGLVTYDYFAKKKLVHK